jgi:hypothetical protein
MRTLTFAAIVADTALHAEQPLPLPFDENHVSGIHDLTVLLTGRYYYEYEPCMSQTRITRPGQIALRRACTEDELRRLQNETWARFIRERLGDPGRH